MSARRVLRLTLPVAIAALGVGGGCDVDVALGRFPAVGSPGGFPVSTGGAVPTGGSGPTGGSALAGATTATGAASHLGGTAGSESGGAAGAIVVPEYSHCRELGLIDCLICCNDVFGTEVARFRMADYCTCVDPRPCGSICDDSFCVGETPTAECQVCLDDPAKGLECVDRCKQDVLCREHLECQDC